MSNRYMSTAYQRGQNISVDGSIYTINEIEWMGQHPHLYPRLRLARPSAPDTIVRPLTPSSYGGSIRIVDDIGTQMPSDYIYKTGDLLAWRGCVYKVTATETLRPVRSGATDGDQDYQRITAVNMTPKRNTKATGREGIDTRSFRPRLAPKDALDRTDGLTRNADGIVQFANKPDHLIRKPRTQP